MYILRGDFKDYTDLATAAHPHTASPKTEGDKMMMNGL